MKHVLIDTNSWIDLYLQNIEEKNLNQLLKWERDGKIKFLLPETLDKEFARQKTIQLDILDKKIKSLSKTASQETLNKLKEEYQHTERKITKIESVLLNAIKIKISKKVHQVVGVRYNEERPPFHKNKHSHNDAYIYFSTIEYLQKNNIDSFVFITRNVNDFGAPENSNIFIHPDLLIPDVNIQYFSPVALAVNRLQQELGLDTNETNSSADYTEIFYLFEEKKEDKIIDQIYRALETYNDQLSFIPTHLLTRIFPFKTKNFRHPEAYHSSFQLNSNNERLINFFNSFSIGKMNSIHFNTKEFRGSEKKVKAKTKEIIQKLNANLIYHISGIGTSLKSDIRLTAQKKCDCIRCAYNRFDIYEAFKLLNSDQKDKDLEILKQGYMHYQFQQFDTALKLFYLVYETSRDNGQQILMFICITNLKRLSRLISQYGDSIDAKTTEIIEIISKVPLRKIRSTISTANPFVNEVIDWIADDKFHSQALENITSTVENIRDHYNNQLRGGFNNNSNLDILISQFAELDVFLESNYLVFNNYLEFEKVVDKLVEGLFMIYSFNRNQTIRLAFINDYLLMRIIMFSKTENIIKYYNRLNLDKITYKQDPTTKTQLPDLAKTFFIGLHKLYQSEEYKVTHIFLFDKNRRILNNFLIMLTLSKDNFNYNEIFDSLFPVLGIERLIMRDEINSLANFLSAKGALISTSRLNNLLIFAIENKQLHEYKIFHALNQLRSKRTEIMIADQNIFDLVKENFMGTCTLCNHSHTDILIPLIPLLHQDFNGESEHILVQTLDQEFNPDMYYSVAIGGIIDYRIHLEKFKELCIRSLQKADGPVHPFMTGEILLYRLSELLNIYFKNGLSTSDTFFSKFIGYSDYYDWLLNIDKFNYKRFNPLWILEYQTYYYHKRIFSSIKLKKHLLKFLKTKKHAILSELFIQYS